MANLKVLGGPIPPTGKTLESATLTASLLDEYADGTARYPLLHAAEWDSTNERWKPAGSADGTFWYLPGQAPGDPRSPITVFTETQIYTDDDTQTRQWRMRIGGDVAEEWRYPDPAPDTVYVPYGPVDLPVIDAIASGIPSDGTIPANTAFQSLLTQIGGAEREIWFPDGNYRFDDDFTVPSTVRIRMYKGAQLKPDSGTTLTLNGPLDAGAYRIFGGSGTVILGGSCPRVLPEWFGAVAGNGTDDYEALLDAAGCLNGQTRTIHFTGNGAYRVASSLAFLSHITLEFEAGSRLEPDAGDSVTIHGPVKAGRYQIFGGSGNIYFNRAPVLFPEWWGAKTNGATDCSPAINKAIDALEGSLVTTGYIDFDNGVYLCQTGLTYGRDRINTDGKGPHATMLLFMPSADGAFLTYERSGSPLYQCSLRNLSIYSTDTTHTKIAVRLVDIREFVLQDVVIAGSGVNGAWSGGGASVAVQTEGRDTSIVESFAAYSDRPVLIKPNLTETDLDLDSWTFRDCYLVGSGNVHPIIEAEDGVSLTNVHFEGRQAWAFGSHGFYYVSSSHEVSPYSVSIKNVRWEQGTNAAGHVVHIDAEGMYNLILENVTASVRANAEDRDVQGFYFRNAKNVRLESCMHTAVRANPELSPPETLVALDVDHSVEELVLENCFFNVGTTLSLGGLILAEGRGRNRQNITTDLATYQGHYTYQRYVSPNSLYQFVDNFGVKVWHDKGRVPSANTITAGTVTLTNGNKAVTGTGTAWTADDAGKTFLDAASNRYIIDSVTDATHLTLKTPYAGATASGASYTIWRRVQLPILNSYTMATVYVSAVGATAREQGVFLITPTGAVKASGTANCDVFGVGGSKLFLLWQGTSNISILNSLGETVDYTVRVEY